MLSEKEQEMNRIAIIGSGITGISVAFQHPANSEIIMFDKSRRPGGRVSTRTSRQQPGYSFDHGAPFVHAKGQFLQLLQKINAVKERRLQVAEYFNQNQRKITEKSFLGGNPQIQTIPLKLIQELKHKNKVTINFDTRITEIDQKTEKGHYILQSQQSKQYGPFNQVYVCIPYPQCKTLKQNIVKFPEQSKQQQASYNCCWVVMAAFAKDSVVRKKIGNVDIAQNIGENISSMVNQSTKGNKSDDDLWVFTMQQKWCQQNINLKPENVQEQFKNKLANIFGKQIDYKFIKAHRWLYSSPKQAPSQPLIGKNLVFGGDWLNTRTNIQQCWQLGPLLYKAMNQKAAVHHL